MPIIKGKPTDKDKQAMGEIWKCLEIGTCTDAFHSWPGTAKPGDPCRCGKEPFLAELRAWAEEKARALDGKEGGK